MTRSSSPIRIGIDARSLSAGLPGVATYVSNLTERIPYLDLLGDASPRNNFLWNQVRVPLAFRSRGWAAYHAPAYTAPLLGCRPLIVSAHDVSYIANPKWYPYPIDSLRLRYYTASLKHADRIIVSSDFTERELVRLLPETKSRVRRIYLGASKQFFPDQVAAERVRSELSLPEPFLLHVGDIHPRRNIPLAVEAAKNLGIALVLVGEPLRGGEEFRDWPLRFAGLDTDSLRGLYGAALALVYPSLYEGFGLPIVEAMACGLPVVAAKTSCLPEVCGDAAVLVDPEVQALCAGVRRAREGRERYRQAGLARAAQFSWDTTALETEKVYAEVVPGLRVTG